MTYLQPYSPSHSPLLAPTAPIEYISDWWQASDTVTGTGTSTTPGAPPFDEELAELRYRSLMARDALDRDAIEGPPTDDA